MELDFNDIRRYDPCPCGSGKPYGICHLGRAEELVEILMLDPAVKELQTILLQQSFSTMDEAQAFAEQYVEQQKYVPKDKFHGLSMERVKSLIYHPFTTPEIVSFPNPLAVTPDAPVMMLFQYIYDGLGENGMKATAKGNLLRNFCREGMRLYMGDEAYDNYIGDFQSEIEMYAVHKTRITMQIAGLIRMYKGKFIRTKLCRDVMKTHGLPGIYPLMIRAYLTKVNWDYFTDSDNSWIVKENFAFSLYLFHKYGTDWRNIAEYQDMLIGAFPAAIAQIVPERYYKTREESFRSAFVSFFLRQFSEYFGLVELERSGKERHAPYVRVRALPLLKEVVKFNL